MLSCADKNYRLPDGDGVYVRGKELRESLVRK